MTQDEIIYDIKERLGVTTDDRSLNFPDAHLLFVYEDCRSTIINQQLNRAGRLIDSAFYQTIRLEMETVDRSFCPLIPVGCKILRSKIKLPSTLTYLHRHALVDRIGGNDVLSKKYKFLEYSETAHVYGGRFADKYVYSFELNGYIYAFSKNKFVNSLDNLVMRSVFDEPSKLADSDLCIEDCATYPMSKRYHEAVVSMTIQALTIKFQIQLDRNNDSSDDRVTIPTKALNINQQRSEQ